MRLAAVVLAAGESRRFGSTSKLLAHVQGEALIRRVTRVTLAAGFGPVIVVTGRERAPCERLLADLPLIFVHNEAWPGGMGGSVAAGVREATAHKAQGALIVPGDMPLLSASLLTQIASAFEAANGKKIVFPVTAGGEQRNPVLWPGRLFPVLSELHGAEGAKKILASRAGETVAVPVSDSRAFLDIDTPEDLAALVADLGGLKP